MRIGTAVITLRRWECREASMGNARYPSRCPTGRKDKLHLKAVRCLVIRCRATCAESFSAFSFSS